jgi:hypothetical protein
MRPGGRLKRKTIRTGFGIEMTDTLLTIIIPGILVIAIVVDIAVLAVWLRRRR